MTKFLLGAGALIAIVSVTPAAAADLAADPMPRRPR